MKMKTGGWDDMSDERKAEAAAAYALGTTLMDTIKNEGVSRDVAFNALMNLLGIVCLNYPDPRKTAEGAGEALIKMVTANHAKNILG
jgi:hypothetical protein